MRFALVEVGTQAAAFVRIAPRLRGGEITAVVDSDVAVAQRLAEQLQTKVWATSADQLHERSGDQFDAWVAVTPVGLLVTPHAQLPVELRSEKWLNNPTGWLWGHAFRFLPSVRTVKDSLASGKLGAAGLVRIHYWQTKSASDVWESLRQQLDVTCWLIGQPPTAVFALGRHGQAGAKSRDYLQVHLGFSDDRMAVIDCATSLAEGDDYYSLSVIGSTGAAYADDHHNMQLVYGGQHPQAIRTSQGDLGLLATLQEFIDATAKSRPPLCGSAEWQRALRLSATVEQSLASGQSVMLEGESR